MIGQWQYTNLGSVYNNSGAVLSVYEIRIAYIINSQNISNNTSNITTKLQVRSTNSQYITYGFKQNSWINDTQVASNQTFDFRSTNTWQEFGTLTKNYSHNDDGTLTLNLKGNFQTTAAGSARPYTGSVSQNVTIPTIPRNSEFASVPNFNIGTSFNVKLKQYASFYDVLTIKIGSSTIKTINAANSTQEISFTSSELDSIFSLTTNASYADFTFELKSYTDSNKTTQVGSIDSANSRGYIINSEPTITSKIGSATNTQNLTGNASKIIKYESIVTISVNFTLKNKATIGSVIINGTGATVSDNIATATFNYPSNNVFDIKVIDSRGFTAQTTLTLEMVNYIQLTLKQDIKRNQPTDGKVKIKYEGYYFDSSFGIVDNTLLVQYRSKCKTDNGSFSDWLSLTPTVENNSYSGELVVDGYDYQKEYEFEIKAEDELNTKTIVSIPISKGKPVFNWEDGFFNVDGEIKKNGNPIFETTESSQNYDLNTLTQSGIYYTNAYTTNAPDNWLKVLVMGGYKNTTDNMDVAQFAISINGKNMWFRTRNSRTWSDWENINRVALWGGNLKIGQSITVNNLSDYRILEFWCGRGYDYGSTIVKTHYSNKKTSAVLVYTNENNNYFYRRTLNIYWDGNTVNFKNVIVEQPNGNQVDWRMTTDSNENEEIYRIYGYK